MKRIVPILIAISLICTSLYVAYYVGTQSVEPETITKVVTETEVVEKVVEVENENLIDPADIVDWNTNGEEISILTKDDYEYYAYKQSNEYNNLRYYAITEVKEWKVENGILTITFTDGNVYEW